MKRLTLLILMVWLLAACSSSNEGIELAKDYTGEVVPIVNGAFLEITGQAAERGELRDGLAEYAEKIREVNGRYWVDGKFAGYTDEQISKWKFLMENNRGDKWEINGAELSEALAYMNLYSSMMADDLEKALADPSEEMYENLGESLGLANEAAESLVSLILNR